MSRMYKETERQLEEAYNHIKPYMKDDETLKDLCVSCPMQKAAKACKYEICQNKTCFKGYLALTYLNWYNSSDGY